MKLPLRYKCNLCSLDYEAGKICGVKPGESGYVGTKPADSETHLCSVCIRAIAKSGDALLRAAQG